MSHAPLLFLSIATFCLSSRVQHLSCLSVNYFLLSVSPAELTTASSPYTFNFTYSTSISGVDGTGLALTGFEIQRPNSYIGFEAELLNTTVTSADVMVSILGNKALRNLKFAIILLDKVCKDRMDLRTRTVYPQILNSPFRNNTSIENQQIFFLPSLRFNTVTISDYQLFAYISAFNVTVEPLKRQDIFITYTELVNWRNDTNGWPQQAVYIWSGSINQNAYQSISLVTMIFKKSSFSTPYFYQEYGFFVDTSISGSPISVSITNPSLLQDNIYSQKCLVFLTNFQTDYDSRWITLTFPSQTEIAINFDRVFYIGYAISCFIECQPGTPLHQTTQDPNSYYCYDCSKALPYCAQCYSPTVCLTRCDQEVLDCSTCHNSSHCHSCFLGHLVSGGCTSDAWCTAVTQSQSRTDNLTAVCQLCQDGFTLSNGVCVCANTSEFAVTGRCTGVQGCVAAVQAVGGTINCVACNSSLGLGLNSENDCACLKEGYTLSEGTCGQLCGDGKNFSHPCDDANTESGDGCSSVCQVQEGFSCYHNGTKSLCKYEKAVDYSFDHISSTETAKEAALYIKVEPALTTLQYADWGSSVTLLIGGLNYIIRAWSYESGQLRLVFGFDTTIEGEFGEVTIVNDVAYLTAGTFNLSFQATSSKYRLIYTEESGLQLALQMAMFVVNLAVLALWLVSVFLHPMLAVELLSTVQLLFLLYFHTEQHTRPFAVLESWTYSWLNILYYFNRDSCLLLGEDYQLLTFSQSNYSLSIVGIACLCFLFAILWAVSAAVGCSQSKRTSSVRFRDTAIAGAVSFTVVLALYSIDQRNRAQYESLLSATVDSAISVTLCCCLGACLGAVWVKPRSFARGSSLNYVRAYLAFLLATTVALSLALLPETVPAQRYAILLLALGMLIYQFVSPPYSRMVHNVGVFLNMLLIVLFISVLAGRDHFEVFITEPVEIYLIVGVVGLYLLIILAALLRIIQRIRQICPSKAEAGNQKMEKRHVVSSQQKKKVGKTTEKVLMEMHQRHLASYFKAQLRQRFSIVE